MIRPARRLALCAVAMLGLTGCFSGEPKVAEADQVPAAQAEALAAAAAASEGGGDGDIAAGPEVTFVAEDILYSEAPDTVPAGGATFVLDNQGAIIHNVVIEELGNVLVVEAEGGETASGQIALEPGGYTYYCDIAGHRAAGMEGTLEAVESAEGETGGAASEPAASEPAETAESPAA